MRGRRNDVNAAERSIGRGWRFIDANAPQLTRRQERNCRELNVRPYARHVSSRYVLAVSSTGDRYSLPPDEHSGEVVQTS